MYKGKLSKGTVNSAGYDIHSTVTTIIPPGERILISTGVFLNLNPSTFGLIKSRSGLSCKGIDVGAGVIDSDYTDEVKVLLINNGKTDFNVEIGMRIAQLIILPYLDLKLNENVIMSAGEHAGFGSTGLF